MNQKVFCQKLKKELDGLERAPFPGELGEKIFKSISKQAWQDWLAKQVMIINENQLSLFDAKSQQFLNQTMEDYLFNDVEIKIQKNPNKS